MQVALLVSLAFLSGSIPFGVLVARRRGVDLQREGSGNIGATNAARVMGRLPGLVVLLLDVAKAALPTYLALRVFGGGVELAAVGMAAMLGHCFSPWLRFRGGKGVACALGVYLVMAPQLTAVAAAVFLVVKLATRVTALGSIAAMVAMAALQLWRGTRVDAIFAVLTAILIVFTHRGNLQQLRARADDASAP